MQNNSQNAWKLSNLEDVSFFAKEIIKKFPTHRLICLYGDLGAGKTAICKEIIKFLTGIETVTSPTFNIVQIYEGNGISVHHYDLYRLKSEEEIFEIGLLESISGGYCLIEWPEIAEKFLPTSRLDIKIEHKDGDVRYAQITTK